MVLRRIHSSVRCLLLVLALAGVAAAAPAELSRLSGAYLRNGKPQDRATLAAYAEKSSSPETQALARFALGMGDFTALAYARAAVELERADGAKGVEPLADYVRFYRARSLAGDEKFREAARLVADFPQRFPQSLLVADAVRLRAESLIRDNNHVEARKLLEASTKTLPGAVRLFLLARTQVLAGDLQEAVSTYRQVYYKYPRSAQASPAEEALNDLRRRLGADYPGAPPAWRLERADLLFNARQYSSAREEYLSAAAGLRGAQRDHAQVRIGASDYGRSRTSEAHAWLSKLQVSDADADAERIYYLGECARRGKRIQQFTDAAEELGRKYPKSPWYEEALFSLGNYYLLENDGRNYREYYDRAARAFPNGKYGALAHWKVCWRAQLDGDPRAASLFEEHLQRYPQSANRSGALYWLARLAERDGDAARGRLIYSHLQNHFPHYYYGYRASERLAELGTVVEVQAAGDTIPYLRNLPGPPPVAAKPTPATARVLDRGRLLFQLGLDDIAEKELRTGDYRGADSHLIGLELAAQKADRGQFHSGLRYMKLYAQGYLRLPLDSMPREFWEKLFPMPFSEELRSYAARHDLDPFLVAALIRQESEFNPGARSRVGALGLMQIMPATGRLLARKAGVNPFSPAKLTDPNLSLRLGTLHLRAVLNQFQNRLELTLAAYNAGEHRVEKWLTWGAFEDPAIFVETIPFTETREYVQSVMRNMAIYRMLYGGNPELFAPSRASLYDSLASP
jgi:soluble lytic murein transglycosylase